MVLYTNTGLVRHAENALGQKTVYMWGGILRLVEKQYDLLYSIYGNKPGTGYTPERWAYLQTLFGKNYFGCDCVGLIKSYYWSSKPDGGTGSPDYGRYPKIYPDVDANTMYNKAKVKGKISDMPETPGIILQRSASNPHVGIYMGDGYTIECTYGSRGDGVVKRKLDKTWTRWFECPYIMYEKYEADVLAFNAALRDKPSTRGRKLGVLAAGTKVVIVVGSDTVDSGSGYVYVRLKGEEERWIVKSAIKP